MRARLVLGIVAALAAAAAARSAVAHRERLRHLAVPVLADPSEPRAPGIAVAALPACEVAELARLGRRVTALLVADDGTLVAGTFDGGVLRLPPAGSGGGWDAALAAPVEGLSGRERLVNALAEHDGLVWVATQGGLVALDGERRALSLLDGEGVTALVRAGGALHAGTARGLQRISVERGAEPVAVAGPTGEPIRVTALAVSGDRLWIGTPSGAYSLPLATLGAPLEARTARWHPLVFGDPPADTNVVTALAAVEGGAVAGTDDGGVVRLRDGGRVHAVRLDEARANEVNPGATVAWGGAAVLGTQGGGLVFARPRGEGLEVGRPAGLDGQSISAVTEAGGALVVGTDSGAILSLRCEGPRS